MVLMQDPFSTAMEPSFKEIKVETLAKATQEQVPQRRSLQVAEGASNTEIPQPQQLVMLDGERAEARGYHH